VGRGGGGEVGKGDCGDEGGGGGGEVGSWRGKMGGGVGGGWRGRKVEEARMGGGRWGRVGGDMSRGEPRVRETGGGGGGGWRGETVGRAGRGKGCRKGGEGGEVGGGEGGREYPESSDRYDKRVKGSQPPNKNQRGLANRTRRFSLSTLKGPFSA